MTAVFILAIIVIAATLNYALRRDLRRAHWRRRSAGRWGCRHSNVTATFAFVVTNGGCPFGCALVPLGGSEALFSGLDTHVTASIWTKRGSA